MKRSLEELVRRRAGAACEYCHIPQAVYGLTFPIDHVIARKHGGKTWAGNLALVCMRCNLYKGPNIASIDPKSHLLVPLFNPRHDRWTEHFRWRGPRLLGLTPVGRATVRVLAINHPTDIELRRMLIADGSFPPRGDLPGG
jgi:5-methylcytosine-specific restriction endonuclease McrA